MDQRYSHQANDSPLFPEVPVQYGGFWERFGAAFLDGLILMLPNFIMQFMFGRDQGFLSSIIINWLYFALQESGPSQATLGKKALGLKVLSVNGRPISFGQATGRFFGRYVSAAILFIGYLMMLWDDKKQTLHDKLAGTIVIKLATENNTRTL